LIKCSLIWILFASHHRLLVTMTVLLTAFLVLSLAEARPWMNVSDTPEARAHKLVAEMTTDEKLSLFHGSCRGYTGNVCGIDRLGIPQQKNNDGPQGFRGRGGTSTSWPAALTVAASFDTHLMKTYGEAMGDEFYRKGANIQLGPGVCLARIPRNGRNFEYVSGEDPFLGYQMANAIVTGIQSQGVIANAKHFIDNNQESSRGTITENIDERTQFEMYYPPFQGAVDAGVGSFMCSYNKICKDCANKAQIGNWSCENHDTLQVDLKERIGFKGWVMSDWGATHSTSMNQGLDQQMPDSSHMGANLAAMVKSGEVSMAKVNDSAVRILWPFFAVGLFDKANNNTISNNVTTAEHNQLARKLSAEATILLKNTGVLPLTKSVKTIAIIGAEAFSPTVHGGGSGQVQPYYTISPLASIRARFGITGSSVAPNNCSDGVYEKGVDFHNTHSQTNAKAATVEDCCKLCAAHLSCNAFTYRWGTCWMKTDASGRKAASDAVSAVCKKGPLPPQDDCHDGVCVPYSNGANTTEAAILAKGADVSIIFVGTSSHEGGDRSDLGLGKQDALIEEVAKVAGSKTIVVAVTPGALLTPWRDAVAAILTPIMPGQEYGNAISDVLFGDVNPGGKLPITFPSKENETELAPSQWPGIGGVSVYSEGLKVGYRWYDSHGVKPAYPFGHGLSYTNFHYSGLQVSGRTVQCTVKNAGSVDGSEAVQLYLQFPASAGEPPKQLKGLQKLRLVSGQSLVPQFTLNDRSFSIWDVKTHKWAVVPGKFGIMIGASSEDIRLTGSVTISGEGDVEIVV